MEESIIRPKKMCQLLGISMATLYNWEKDGTMPIEKIKFGPNCVGYRSSDYRKWMNGELETEIEAA